MNQDLEYHILIPAAQQMLAAGSTSLSSNVLFAFSYQLLCCLEDALREALSWSGASFPKDAETLEQICQLSSEVARAIERSAKSDSLPPAWPDEEALASSRGQAVRSALAIAMKGAQPSVLPGLSGGRYDLPAAIALNQIFWLMNAALHELGLLARCPLERGESFRASLTAAHAICGTTLDLLSACQNFTGVATAASDYICGVALRLEESDLFETGGELAVRSWRSIRASIEVAPGRIGSVSFAESSSTFGS